MSARLRRVRRLVYNADLKSPRLQKGPEGQRIFNICGSKALLYYLGERGRLVQDRSNPSSHLPPNDISLEELAGILREYDPAVPESHRTLQRWAQSGLIPGAYQ